MNEKKRLGYGFKALSNGIGGGGRGGEGGVFVVLIMNEKRNEWSESCRQANFFTAEFQYSISYSTLFFAQLYQYW